MKKHSRILKTLAVALAAALPFAAGAQKQFTRIFDENIRTLELKPENAAYSYPVVDLRNPDDRLTVSFDELSHAARSFSYTVTHCNADWTPDNLSRFEYIDGADYADIDDYEFSVNTYVEYTHYRFSFPSENMRPTLSGNYLILIYETGYPENVRAQARCYVADLRADIEASVRTSTDIDINAKHQQVDFSVNTNALPTVDPLRDFKVTVVQNRRTDNAAENLRPTAVGPGRLSFANNRNCIFEAGNEYRNLDISNIYIKDFDVRDMRIIDGMWHVEMYDAAPRKERYTFYADANGKFRVNLQRNHGDDDTEADYAWVHFFVPDENPLFGGSLYVAGDFNAQLFVPENRMEYDAELGGYRKSFLLKQGGYNYQYLFLPKNGGAATGEPFEGNFWQTKNEYEIFVYYRPPQKRYDQLVGYKLIEY